ncbi:hypothetical protein BO71DRAFT_423960 [Aspergillus ellipticus CBS 707.79]|uniref:Uncharacterized protein n=1 Tax=Aspergillus ellipticus CBS 707.79 TaxID=1448320 RepID=A0A319CRT4_9EURO|nr:hypothetical protein BO71DRAFT_423960 [Aspergillus ellipticus CBS 707.79]
MTTPAGPSIWADRDVQEACLMRYSVEVLAPWGRTFFDSCDARKHFALVATGSRAAASISGRALPPLGDGAALDYQSLCIAHLRSLSGDAAEIQSPDLLAAAPHAAALAGGDDGTYLRGAQVFLDAQSASALRQGGLRLAAFWVGVRQEFHKAFLEERAIGFDLSCFAASTYRQLDPADDATWANRIVLHCAHVLAYCYGDASWAPWRYEALCEYNRQWQALTPQTFDPIFCRPPNRSQGGIFPVLWYLDDCIVTAVQHWHLARLLLAVFDPRVPRMGPSRKAAVARREAEIKHHVFSICGIALSNKTAPALVAACMGVTMCGDRISDRLEQAALLEILTRTEETHGLSTAKAQTHLQAAWDWVPASSDASTSLSIGHA